MANKITYYAIVDDGRPADRPLGLLRRLEHDDGPEDEGLRHDLSWRQTSLIIEWEHGSLDDQLVEVSHAQASRIVQYFRDKLAAEPGQSSASS
jgi:hypothetical protein